MAAAALGQVSSAVAAPLTALAGFPAAYVMWVAHVASGVPGAQATVPVAVVAAASLLVMLAIASRRARPVAAAALLATLALAAALPRGQAGAATAPAGLR